MKQRSRQRDHLRTRVYIQEYSVHKAQLQNPYHQTQPFKVCPLESHTVGETNLRCKKRKKKRKKTPIQSLYRKRLSNKRRLVKTYGFEASLVDTTQVQFHHFIFIVNKYIVEFPKSLRKKVNYSIILNQYKNLFSLYLQSTLYYLHLHSYFFVSFNQTKLVRF